MREKFMRFMAGRYARYGIDGFNKFLFVAWLIVSAVGSFLPRRASHVIILLADVIIIYSLFRLLSRNIPARQKENSMYYYYRDIVVKFFKGKKSEFSQRKSYRFFRCGNCGQKVRVPKGRGKIEITCPKCGNHFIKRT